MNNAEQNALQILFKMTKSRMFEDRLTQLKEEGEINDRLHLATGQEATIAAVCAVQEDDIIFATHRSNHIAIGSDVDIKDLLKEYYGRDDGLCGGKSGGVGYCDNRVNYYGSSAIAGAQFSRAVGAALSMKIQQKKSVVLCFAGEGACVSGEFYEAINFAAMRELPIIFFVENNCYSKYSNVLKLHNLADVSQRAKGFDIESAVVDGNDAIEIYTTIQQAREFVVANGPMIVESNTYRICGYDFKDEAPYREKKEILDWKAYDPIDNLEDYIVGHNIATIEDFRNMQEDIERELEEIYEEVINYID